MMLMILISSSEVFVFVSSIFSRIVDRCVLFDVAWECVVVESRLLCVCVVLNHSAPV